MYLKKKKNKRIMNIDSLLIYLNEDQAIFGSIFLKYCIYRAEMNQMLKCSYLVI